MSEVEVFSFGAKRTLKSETISRSTHLIDSNGNLVIELASNSWKKDLKEASAHLKKNGWKIISVFPSAFQKATAIDLEPIIFEVTIVAER